MMYMHHVSHDTTRLRCACSALRKASRAVTRFYDAMLADTGLSIVQFSILRDVERNDGLHLMVLARQQAMDRTTVYRALKPMEREGWVVLEKGDGRSKIVTLTDLGRQMLKGAADRWDAAQDRFISRVGSQWAEIDAHLARVVDVACGTDRG